MFHKNKMRRPAKRHERGLEMLEMAIGSVVFSIAAFGIIEVSRAMATYNALSDAVRRGARYAATQKASNVALVRNMVVYRTSTVGMNPVAIGLTTSHVVVTYSTGYGMSSGSVKVEIPNYSFHFMLPLIGATYRMTPFSATANAESAGVIPGTI